MKMAVVGCEASGKTVFMCALADYFGRDAATNPSRLKLTPENAAANKFERFQFRQMRCQRQWPPATPPDRAIEIKWSLRQGGEAVASVDLIEFGGETFRAAFRESDTARHEGATADLLKYLSDADFIVVLVSLKSLLANPTSLTDEDFDRETEALWVTRGLLEFIRKYRPNAGVVIGLTQADKYRDEIEEAGGPRRCFAAHWPTVAGVAEKIPVVEVASVSKTDENGNPAEGYRTHGVLPVMRIFARHCFGDEDALESGTAFGRPLAAITDKSASAQPGEGIPEVTAEVPPPCKPALSRANAVSGSQLPCKPAHLQTNAVSGSQPPCKPALLQANAVSGSQPPAPAAPAATKPPEKSTFTRTLLLVILGVCLAWGVFSLLSNDSGQVPMDNSGRPLAVEKIIEKAVTNTVEKIVERPITNTVEKIVEKPVTNMVEKIVKIDRPVTNTIEKIVERPVTNTVEKIVERPVTNTVEKIVQIFVTNVLERVIEKTAPASLALPPTNAPVTVEAPKSAPGISESDLQSQVPPGFRIWTDYNGRKIIAKWTEVSADGNSITIITRYNRRIDAVLWKFSPEDQAYIKAEIKQHADKGELMSGGNWVRNPLLR